MKIDYLTLFPEMYEMCIRDRSIIDELKRLSGDNQELNQAIEHLEILE